MPASNARNPVVRHPVLAARGLLALTAIAWGVFAVLSASTPPAEAERAEWIGYVYAGALILVLGSLAIGSWLAHRWTGAAAVLVGLGVACFFDHLAPQLAMALPLTLAGVTLLWRGDQPRAASTTRDDDLPPAPKQPQADDDLDLV
ncbi:MAG: hypothetical protein RIB60_11725 [Phycisphaerales bacterium]